MERSTANLIPIKSSLSLILGDTQVWSNTICASADFTQRNCNSSEDAHKFDVFAQRLAEKHLTKKGDAQECERRTKKYRQVFTYSQPPVNGVVADFTGKDIEVYESRGGQDVGLFCGMEPHLCEETPRRQLYQHPRHTIASTSYHVPGGIARSRTSDIGINCIHDSGPEISYPRFLRSPEEATPFSKFTSQVQEHQQVPPPSSTCLVPDGIGQTSGPNEGSYQRTHVSFGSEIRVSHPQVTQGEEKHKDSKLKTCFPSRRKSGLFYTVSESSLPLAGRSSLGLSRILSQGMPVPIHNGLEEQLIRRPKAFMSVSGIRSSCSWFGESKMKKDSYNQNLGRSIFISPRCTDIMIKWKDLDEAFARKIAETMKKVTDTARKGKLMNYAKFNSSFKLSEVFYEDISSRSLSHVPSVAPFQLSGLVHKVNPDFDENQSISEAMTVMKSISSIISAGMVTTVCQLASTANSKTNGNEAIGNRLPNKSLMLSSNSSNWKLKPNHEPADVSSISANSGVSFADVISTARKLQLSKFQDSLQSTLQGGPKETDIWSSSASTCYKEMRPTPKRLVDILSSSCIFRASLVERVKRPVWRLKSDKSGENYSVDLVNFIFKAYHYMCMRSRPSYRCFFQQQPAYRVVDEGVQFPDIVTGDRSSNVKEPSEYNNPTHNGVNSPPVDQSHPSPIAKANDQEAAVVTPAEINDNLPKSQTQLHLGNLNVIVACDKPIYSTSEFPTISVDTMDPSQAAVAKTGTEEDSSANPPASASSNKYHFSSSEYPNTISFQPRVRKLVKSKMEPIAEHPVKSRLEPAAETTPKRSKARNQRLTQHSQFCRSYRAFCDHRKIRIKYENGRYSVIKETDRSKRQTVWSLLTGKATRLLNSVMLKKPRAHRVSKH